MTIQPGANVYTQGFGSRPENVEVPHIDVRPPSSSDTRFPIGKNWIDTVGKASYVLLSQSTSNGVVSSTWSPSSGGTTELSTLTGDTGTATPVGGNIKISGTTNQITTTAGSHQVTLSLPNPFDVPGQLNALSDVEVFGILQVDIGGISCDGPLSVASGASIQSGANIEGNISLNAAPAGHVTINTVNDVSTTIGNTTGAAPVSISAGTSGITLTGAVTHTGALNVTSTITAGTGITSTTGNIVATAGAVNAGTTMTAGTGITATTGNIVATAGAVTAGTTVTATSGNITATNGNLVLNTAGNKIVSTSVASTTTAGANSFGTVALSSGAAVVNTSSVKTASIILLTTQVLGTVATPMPIAVTARVDSTSFTITSSDGTDTSTIGWMIIN